MEIYRLPYFNMLFQIVLTKYFKSELFSCLAKVDQAMPKAYWSSAAGKCSPLWSAVHETGAPNENIVQNHLNIASLNVF